MLTQEDPIPPSGTDQMSLLMAAELQDHLMVASNDLERLQRLIGDAGDSLLSHFYGVTGELQSLLSQADASPLPVEPLNKAMQHMASAITAMQFQDMATQLVGHTTQRLRNCADRLASDSMGDDEDGAAVVAVAPLRPNPVTQDEMDAGSIELF
jgi:hypothetical protein